LKKKTNFVISRQIETQPTATPRDAAVHLNGQSFGTGSSTFRWLDDPNDPDPWDSPTCCYPPHSTWRSTSPFNDSTYSAQL